MPNFCDTVVTPALNKRESNFSVVFLLFYSVGELMACRKIYVVTRLNVDDWLNFQIPVGTKQFKPVFVERHFVRSGFDPLFSKNSIVNGLDKEKTENTKETNNNEML